MSHAINFKGQVGFGIRELTAAEFAIFCTPSRNETLFKQSPPISSPDNLANSFNSSFSLRVFTSGCYYMTEANKWSSFGIQVMKDTNITHTHCLSSHLSEFAGGFVVLPPAVDFNYAFANASFSRNALIYSLVIAFILIYIIVGLWCYYMDRLDRKKTRINLLADNKLDEDYYYEIIVYTGNRKNASTDSNVSFILYGSKDETDERRLETIGDKKDRKKQLKRGGIDSYIMSVKK